MKNKLTDSSFIIPMLGAILMIQAIVHLGIEFIELLLKNN